MRSPLLLMLVHALLHPVSSLLDAPARALTRWSDDTDEIWEPFLDDGPLVEGAPLAA